MGMIILSFERLFHDINNYHNWRLLIANIIMVHSFMFLTFINGLSIY
jgi:hypothetical protein